MRFLERFRVELNHDGRGTARRRATKPVALGTEPVGRAVFGKLVTDDGTDEWFLIKEEDKENYIVVTIDFHIFSENEIELKSFDSLLRACNYIRDELDRDFTLGGAETADAVIGLLDALFGD